MSTIASTARSQRVAVLGPPADLVLPRQDAGTCHHPAKPAYLQLVELAFPCLVAHVAFRARQASTKVALARMIGEHLRRYDLRHRALRLVEPTGLEPAGAAFGRLLASCATAPCWWAVQ